MYLKNTRPTIWFVVNTLSQYLVKPRWVHMIAVKHVMRYLKGTIDMGLYYGRDHDYKLYGYMDSDWAGSAADRKSTSGGCYCLGSAMISWFSKKQFSLALSLVEAEYIASCSAIFEAICRSKVDVRSIWPRDGYHDNSMWQPELYKDDGEPNVPWQIKAHRNPVFLHKG